MGTYNLTAQIIFPCTVYTAKMSLQYCSLVTLSQKNIIKCDKIQVKNAQLTLTTNNYFFTATLNSQSKTQNQKYSTKTHSCSLGD